MGLADRFAELHQRKFVNIFHHRNSGRLGALARGLVALSLLAQFCLFARTACAADETSKASRYALKAEHVWRIDLPDGERFDASALCFDGNGKLLTLSDRGLKIYRLEAPPKSDTAKLTWLTNLFPEAKLKPFSNQKADRLDVEGIGRDESGRIYVSEEGNRWILRTDAEGKNVERLDIDWKPVQKYFSGDPNASFEGVAAGDGKIFVANERSVGRIIVVDQKSLKILDDFQVQPIGMIARDVHYSDLSWFKGELWVLCRESFVVLRVDPKTHKVLSEYHYGDVEKDLDSLYYYLYPTGNMEGLAVDDDTIWLVTDNNGMARVRAPKDTRPTLFRCPRPDAPKK